MGPGAIKITTKKRIIIPADEKKMVESVLRPSFRASASIIVTPITFRLHRSYLLIMPSHEQNFVPFLMKVVLPDEFRKQAI